MEEQRILQDLKILVDGRSRNLGIVRHVGKIHDGTITESRHPQKRLNPGKLRVTLRQRSPAGDRNLCMLAGLPVDHPRDR